MTVYVDSNAGGANDGTSWTDAYTSLASTTGVAAGTEILIDDGHNQSSTASWTWSNSTRANPVKILSVDKADDSLSAGATIQVSSGTMELNNAYFHGLTFQPVSHGYLGSAGYTFFENCTIEWKSNANFIVNRIGYSPDDVTILQGCTIDFSNNTGSNAEAFFLGFAADLRVYNSTFTKAANHTILFQTSNTDGILILLDSCDVSSYSTITDSMTGHNCRVILRKCKVASSPTVSGLAENCMVTLENCDDGTISVPPLGLTKYQSYQGSASSTLSVYRTGGAVDGENANAYSWEMTTNSNALEIYNPHESPPMAAWVAPDASPSGATAQGLFQSTRMAPLGTPTALTTDSGSTWNGSGVGTKQKIDVTIGDYTLTVYVASGATLNNDDFWVEVSAPDQVGGPVVVRAFLAKPSTTVYVDPRLEVA